MNQKVTIRKKLESMRSKLHGATDTENYRHEIPDNNHLRWIYFQEINLPCSVTPNVQHDGYISSKEKMSLKDAVHAMRNHEYYPPVADMIWGESIFVKDKGAWRTDFYNVFIKNRDGQFISYHQCLRFATSGKMGLNVFALICRNHLDLLNEVDRKKSLTYSVEGAVRGLLALWVREGLIDPVDEFERYRIQGVRKFGVEPWVNV
jgi:hypothetical protein